MFVTEDALARTLASKLRDLVSSVASGTEGPCRGRMQVQKAAVHSKKASD